MQILPPTDDNIARAAAALRAGELVAMPTETVYGLAGNAFDDAALASIFSVKERPTFDPLICHVAAGEHDNRPWLARLSAARLVDADQLSLEARALVERLATTFWPGPLTLVVPKQPSLPDLATSGLPTVAIRAPRHPVAQALLRAADIPLAAPSANRFGRISPTTAAHVVAELGDRVSYVLDGGPCEIGIESTVLLVDPDGRLTLLRPGGVPAEAITEATGAAVARAVLNATGVVAAPSPGLLASHYAPRKPLRLLPAAWPNLTEEDRTCLLHELPPGARLGVIVVGEATELRSDLAERGVVVVALSKSGDPHEAARNLFATLRALDDDLYIDQLWAEPMPDDRGLAHAINDRLRRASHK